MPFDAKVKVRNDKTYRDINNIDEIDKRSSALEYAMLSANTGKNMRHLIGALRELTLQAHSAVLEN
jgi:hypothetical protein